MDNDFISNLNDIYILIKELYEKLPFFVNKNELKNYLRDLKRIEQEIKRGLIFVTIQGSLKTGKSTLTNLLAKSRSEVAITRLGQDTTAVPYIITRSSDKNLKLILFKKRGSIENNEKKIDEIISQIIDYIKELDLKELWEKDEKDFDFEKKIIENPTYEDIKKYTVGDIDDEILIVNIQVPKEDYDSILDFDAALLDTPGVESDKIDDDIRQLLMKKIRNNTSIVIAMQSTITPINKEEIKALMQYKNTISKENFYFIHNMFEIKPWADEEDKQKLQEKEKEAILNAKKTIKKRFSIDPRIDSFNLEKVKDNLFSGSEEYKKNIDLKNEAERFMEFEEILINKIKQQRQRINYDNAYTKFNAVLQKISKTLNDIYNEIEGKIIQVENKKEQILHLFNKAEKELKEIDDEIIKILENDKYYNEQILDIVKQYGYIRMYKKPYVDVSKKIERKLLGNKKVVIDKEKIYKLLIDFNRKLFDAVNKGNREFIENAIKNIFNESDRLNNFRNLKDNLKSLYGFKISLKEKNLDIPLINITYSEKNILELEYKNINTIAEKYVEERYEENKKSFINKVKEKFLSKPIGYILDINRFEDEIRTEYKVEEEEFLKNFKKEIESLIYQSIGLEEYKKRFEESFNEENKEIFNQQALLEEIKKLIKLLNK
ncbi:dynamin family protein [Caminibacter sp.]